VAPTESTAALSLALILIPAVAGGMVLLGAGYFAYKRYSVKRSSDSDSQQPVTPLGPAVENGRFVNRMPASLYRKMS
jgi:hypothetical protein